ncbi:MAG TPA: carboxypeptidase-like regulatory domain-containing protein, partial [Pyrinomonadaceae bacterium]
GRVFNGKTAVSGATVTLTDAHGNVRSVKTGSFGYFRFENVQAGQTVVIQASAKGLFFNPQAITPMEDVEDLNFLANF